MATLPTKKTPVEEETYSITATKTLHWEAGALAILINNCADPAVQFVQEELIMGGEKIIQVPPGEIVEVWVCHATVWFT